MRLPLWLALAAWIVPLVVFAGDGCEGSAPSRPFVAPGGDLTPLGAERSGNAEGTIPPWTGGLTSPPKGWIPEKGYVDPFPEDKPLFAITRENHGDHDARLSPGLVALLSKVDGFVMPVYPTRRSATLPEEVLSEVSTQAGTAEIHGCGVVMKRYNPVPFPTPRSGLEAIWNHLMRYLGGGVERTIHAYPVRPSGEFYRISFHSVRVYNSNMDEPATNRLFSAVGQYVEPAQLVGTSFLVHEPMDQVLERRRAWVYNAGMRRIRRAPDLGYDGIPDGSEGMFTADQIDAYSGAPDRYDWTLIGKREVYVPYNTYRIGLKGQEDSFILRRGSVNPDLMRYELHRVWVVEATLRPGMTHIYGKRVFYLDEDSWSVVLEEAYSTRGDLWRVALHGLIQYYDARVPWYRLGIYHDLQNGAYFVGGLDHGIKSPVRFGVKGRDVDFRPDALRRSGTR
jgi:hypothetical protein